MEPMTRTKTKDKQKSVWKIFFEQAQSDLDLKRLQRIEKDFRKAKPSLVTYADVERHFKRLWKEAAIVGLDTAPPKRVLDLGTGGGHFVYICKMLGHDAVGLERTGSGLEPFHQWMQINVVYHDIAARRPLPSFDDRFDMVTGWRVLFYKIREADSDGGTATRLFELEEWAFFLDDVRDNVLRPGGKLALKLSRHGDEPGLHYGDKELMKYFRSCGMVSDMPDLHVIFDPLK